MSDDSQTGRSSGGQPTMDLEEYSTHSYAYAGVVPGALATLVAAPDVRVVADFGCGDGTILMGLRDRGLLDRRRVTAIEGSAKRVERLKARWPGLDVAHSDVCAVPQLADGSVDLALSTQVIEHVEDESAMLREMSRVLRPGGVLYLTTIFKRRYAWYFYRCRGRWALDPTHLREYRSNDELVPLLQHAGFELRTECKVQLRFPVVDPLLRRRQAQDVSSGATAVLRRLKAPIPGYFEWELVAIKAADGNAEQA